MSSGVRVLTHEQCEQRLERLVEIARGTEISCDMLGGNDYEVTVRGERVHLSTLRTLETRGFLERLSETPRIYRVAWEHDRWT